MYNYSTLSIFTAMAINASWGRERNNMYSVFDQYKHWIDFYGKRSGIKIKIDENLPAPAAMPDNTQWEDPTVIINPKLMKGDINLSDAGVLQVIFHEIEHLKEDTELKSTPQWRKVAEERIKRFEAQEEMGQTYHTLENIVRDVFVNNQTVDPKNAPVLKQTLRTNYTEHFAKNRDFLNFPVHDANDHNKIVEYTKLPKHLQFSYALLREEMIPDEQCNVEPDVRKALTRMKKSGIIKNATQWTLGQRLQNIWKYIEPTYTRFLEEDIKDQEKKDPENNNQDNDNQQDKEWQQSKQNNQQPSSKPNPQNSKQWKEQQSSNESKGNSSQKQWQDKKSTIEKMKEKLSDLLKGKDKKPDTKSEKPQPSENNADGKAKNPFEDLYKQAPQSPHLLEDALSDEDYKKLQEAVQKHIAKTNAPSKSKEQLEREQRALKIREQDKSKSVEELLAELEEYDKFYRQLQQVRNSDTWNTVMEDIEELFKYIRSQRLKPQLKPRWPVDIDHSIWKLHTPSVASGIAELLWGNVDAELWEEHTKKEKTKNYVGKFEVSIVADGTGSMDWEKNRQQKINVLLIFEALKHLRDMLEDSQRDMTEWMEFETEWYIFGKNSRKIKQLWPDFSDTERLKVYKALDEDDWPDNNEGLLLERMYNDFSQNSSDIEKQEIKQSKKKKIIFILTDWEQDVSEYEKKLVANIHNFREDGVLVYGIGITNGWASVTELYADRDQNASRGFGKVCEDPEALATTLLDLLSPHLKQ